MLDTLKKINWFPKEKIIPNEEVKLSEEDAPWLQISEIFSGLFITCEESLCNRVNAQKAGMTLILTMNGEEHVAPYRVYEYSNDLKRCIYRKITSFNEFIYLLDEYTSNDLPEDYQFRKVFLRSITAEDSSTYDISRHFPEMCILIELIMVNRKKIQDKQICLPSVVIHCLVGVSRSVAVATAYIMKRTGYSKDESLSIIKKVRSVANPNPGFQTQLSQWEEGGYFRVVDDFTASITSNELVNNFDILNFMEKQLPLLLCFNKFSSDREFFGLVIMKLNLNKDNLSNIIKNISNYINKSIEDEIYVDVPAFFNNVCEIIFSLIYYSPKILSSIPGESGKFFDDIIYFEMFKKLSISSISKYPSDVARAFCSFLEAIYSKHLSKNPDKSLKMFNSTGELIKISHQEIVLSFPFLPFLSPYAEGFVEYQIVKTFEDDNLNIEQIENIMYKLLNVFQENFLLTTSGTGFSSDSKYNSSRWHPGSRILYLKLDMEIQIMESVEKGSTLLNAVSPFLNFDNIDSNLNLIWVQKLAGALIGIRLFYDAIDRFFNHNYEKLFPNSIKYSIADKLAPWQEISDILHSVDVMYTQKYGNSPNLYIWIKEQFKDFVSNGIIVFPT